MNHDPSSKSRWSSLARAMRGSALWAIGLVGAMVASGAGCSHAHAVGDGTPGSHAASERRHDERLETRRDRRSDDPQGDKELASSPPAHKAGAPDRVRSSDDPNSPVLATSPGGLLRPHALHDIQERLASRGLLAHDHQSETLDQPTREALRSLQRNDDLPATGMPDDATVRRLGLDPARVFVAPARD